MDNYKNDGSGSRLYSDAAIEWRPERIYIPAWQFSGLDYETTTSTDIKSIGVGAGNDLAVAEINTSNITGVSFGADADTLEHLLMVPSDMDIQKNIYFRVYWTANNTSGSVTWDVLYKTYIPGTTTVGSGAATTALDSTIGAHSMAGVAYTLMRTPEGVLKAGTLAETCEMLQLSVKRTGTTTVSAALFLGLEIRYSPRRLRGPDGMKREAKAPATITSKQYS